MMKKENLHGQMNLSDIKVFENVLCPDNIDKIQKYLLTPKSQWCLNNMSTEKSVPFWSMDLNSNKYFTQDLYSTIISILDKKQKDVILERVYANGQTFGQDGDFHPDSGFDYAYTFLYYCNPTWHPSWAGNTMFYCNKTRQMKQVMPSPNTAVFFPGKILHCGQSPSRKFNGLRVTLAYKLYFQTRA